MKLYLSIIFLVFSQATNASDRNQKIHSLLNTLGTISLFEQQLEDSRTQIEEWGKYSFEKGLADLEPSSEYQTKFDAVFTKYMDTAMSSLNTKQIYSAWVKFYGEKFTDAELDQLLAFYKSKLGQRDIEVSHEAYAELTNHISANSAPAIEQAVNTFTEELQQLIKQCNCIKQNRTSAPATTSNTEDELDKLLRQARLMRKDKQYGEALKLYLEVFEKVENTSYAGVRLSYVPSEILAMADDYPEARSALQDIRDIREKSITANRPTRHGVQEWATLSNYLDGSGYIFDYYDLLKNTGSNDPILLSTILERSWQYFVEAKRYTEIKSLAYKKMGEMTMMLDSVSESSDSKLDNDTRNSIAEYAASEYSKVFEVLLANNDDTTADTLSTALLKYSKTGIMYRALIESAKQAGRDAVSDILFSEASSTLSAEELKIMIEGKPKDLECEGPKDQLATGS